MMRRCAWAMLGPVLLTLAGCGETELDVYYGSTSNEGHSSVNGLGVLADLMASRKMDVWDVDRLYPSVRTRADVIVWAPNDYLPPSPEARKWLEDWLVDEPGRTLVYVMHDYDAEADYWAAVAPQAPQAMANEVGARAAAARGRFLAQRASLPTRPEDWGWFIFDGTYNPRRITTLTGNPNWLQGVNASKLEIPLSGRITAKSPKDEIVLASNGDAVVLRHAVADSQVLVLANGAFVLNYGLINHEHRKLASSLLDEMPAGATVVILESDSMPLILHKDPEFTFPTPLEEFGDAPFFPVYSHLAVLAIVACFAYWPLFGRARNDKPRNLTDFGEHVQALGELLKRSKDTAFARARLMHYRQLARADGKRRREFVALFQAKADAQVADSLISGADAASADTIAPNQPQASNPPASGSTA